MDEETFKLVLDAIKDTEIGNIFPKAYFTRREAFSYSEVSLFTYTEIDYN